MTIHTLFVCIGYIRSASSDTTETRKLLPVEARVRHGVAGRKSRQFSEYTTLYDPITLHLKTSTKTNPKSVTKFTK